MNAPVIPDTLRICGCGKELALDGCAECLCCALSHWVPIETASALVAENRHGPEPVCAICEYDPATVGPLCAECEHMRAAMWDAEGLPARAFLPASAMREPRIRECQPLRRDDFWERLPVAKPAPAVPAARYYRMLRWMSWLCLGMFLAGLSLGRWG
jgi:hypothetical protein